MAGGLRGVLLVLLTAGIMTESLVSLVASPRSLYGMWLAAVLVAQFIALMSPAVRRKPSQLAGSQSGYSAQQAPR
jgi:hypothetical protein